MSLFGKDGPGVRPGKNKNVRPDSGGLFGMPAPGASGGFFNPSSTGGSSASTGGLFSSAVSSAGVNSPPVFSQNPPGPQVLNPFSKNTVAATTPTQTNPFALPNSPGVSVPSTLFSTQVGGSMTSASTNLFASSGPSVVTQTSNLFGQSTPASQGTQGLFSSGASGALFGGQQQQQPPKESSKLFGLKTDAPAANENTRTIDNVFAPKVATTPSTSSGGALFTKPDLRLSTPKAADKVAFGKSDDAAAAHVFGKPTTADGQPAGGATPTLFKMAGSGGSGFVFGTGNKQPTAPLAAKGSSLFGGNEDNKLFGGNKSEDNKLFGGIKSEENKLFGGIKSEDNKLFGGIKSVDNKLFGGKTSENKLFTTNKTAPTSGKLFGDSGSSGLFGKSTDSGSGTLFGKTSDITRSVQFGEQPDIVKPSLSSRLGPPPSQDKEEGQCEEEEEEQEDEEGEEEGEVDEGEGDAEEGEAADAPEEDVDEGQGAEEPEVETKEQEEQPTQPARRKLIRAFSKEELQSVTSIVCEQVPNILNNRTTLTNHFSRFGTVNKVTSIPKSRSAHVHFTDHKSAKLAKSRGKLVHPDIEPIGVIHYVSISPSGKKRVRHSTGGSSASMESDAAATTTAVTKPTAPVNFGTAKAKVVKKPFSLSRALKPQGMVKSSDEGVTGNISSGVVRNTENLGQLLAIMKTQTFNDSDKLAVLEARDKYMRLRNPGSVTRSGLNIEQQNLKGTCPDMCPERERYSRSVKNQLRWFEKEGGDLNHLAAIKEHSRSAADQDVPLSHELRPPSVLNRTLNYLMCNIVDKIDFMGGSMADWFTFVETCHEAGQTFLEPMANFPQGQSQQVHFSVGDWFEFVWSMIRAVGKDITQQNLADTVSVSLVEKSARFYIFCSERLIEEDAHDFDPKLNNENLTKCLQTLKHMYYDLRLEGVRCENEAEFQAYDILLNINQGGTLRKVQEFDDYIRKHQSVVHALKIYSAVDGNNYVRFFRLARQSSFLELCILKRYFYQIRRRALEIMVRAFVAPRQQVHFSMDKIFDMLAFESQQECAAFLRQHGIESEGEIVFLERNTFRMPETAAKQRRSYNLIDSKKTVSYGEIMNGGPLPVNPYLSYRPHCSFDSNGYLKVESYEAKDQNGGQTPEELRQQKEEEEKRQRLQKVAAVVSEEILGNIVELEAAGVAREAIKVANLSVVIRETYARLEQETMNEELKEIAISTFKMAKNELLMKRLEQEREAEAEEEAIKDIVEDLVLQNIETVAEQSYAEARKAKRTEARLTAAGDIVDDLVTHVSRDLATELAKEAMREQELELQETVNTFIKQSGRRTLSRCFKMWRLLAAKQRKKNQVMDDFPVGAAPLSPSEQNRRLSRSPQVRHRKPLAQLHAESEQLDTLLRLAEVNKRIKESAVLMPFNIMDLLEDSEGSMPVYKLLVSTEDLKQSDDFYPFQQMVLSKFRKMFPKSETSSEFLVCRSIPLRSNSVLSLCVRTITPKTLESAIFSERERRRIFSGASGLLFLHLDPEVNPADRLHSFIVNRPSRPGVPLQVVTCWDRQQFTEKVDLQRYKDDKLLSDFAVHEAVSSDVFNVTSCDSLARAVSKLVTDRPREDPTQSIKKKPLSEYLEGFLTTQIFGEMLRNRMDRSRKGLADRSLTDLVDLYNAGLDHLVTTLQDPELAEMSWPAQEFCHLADHTWDLPPDWNDTLYIDQAVQTIHSLRMEDFDIMESDSWRDLCDQVWAYVRTNTIHNQDCSQVVHHIQRALARTQRKFAQQSAILGGDTRPVPPAELLPWTEILISCAQHRIASLPESDSEKRVGYRQDLLHSFLLPKDWMCGMSWGNEQNETKINEHLNDSVSKFRDSLTIEDNHINPKLHQLLREEQRASIRQENKLEESLRDDYVPDAATLMLDISKLEEEEENLKRAEQRFQNDETLIFKSKGDSDLEDENIDPADFNSSFMSQLSPRLCMLFDSPVTRSRRSTEGRHIDRQSLPSERSGQPAAAWESGRKRKKDRILSGDKRSRRSFEYRDEISPGLKMEVTGRLDTLKHAINHEIEQSSRLEAKLREALNN